ncbi:MULTISPECIES: MFS transporter [Pseudonocardia]|uniref:Major Facilitator Superfamily protein n=2 Tax=Pseudonocardia TaxID=1847 RepID=A0A1Y2MGU4_PSEAH|nr:MULTISPECIES: MFS transporter [Pseudonocardia]OSY34506.1 Major Facilitator Superfamily protein [Pseudonocardia autotrophica]TDN65674.1 MFS transporter [Pseudonocardia autotrophica]BBG05825.1 MFS transporter [Pseudonocardia autotrophica]GEC29648.1 MFS transporter [Pseudonocardia saturnea]
MTDRPRGGLPALCAAQIVSWGLLYYSLPVAVAPISQETGWSHTVITAALSAGLIVSALAGIRVGRLLDSHSPRAVMTTGSVVGVGAMLLVAWSPNLLMFFLAWVVAGFAQAAVLYPPAFAVITRWYGTRRVGPLTTLTLVGGLASTVFAPLVAYLVDQFGWRVSYLLIAGILAVTTVPLHALFLNGRWTATLASRPEGNPTAAIRTVTRSRQFITLQITMAIATFTLFAVTINIIPMFLERGMSYGTAALALGLIGAGQVVGRVGYPQFARVTSAKTRTGVIFGAGAAGLWALALLPGPVWLLIAVAVLAGAVRGCHTLLQATAVSDRWGTQNFGTINGVFTAPMTFVGAFAPVAGPAVAGLLNGYPMMAAVMALLLTGAAVLTCRT